MPIFNFGKVHATSGARPILSIALKSLRNLQIRGRAGRTSAIRRNDEKHTKERLEVEGGK
jgi:hypothetical protein